MTRFRPCRAHRLFLFVSAIVALNTASPFARLANAAIVTWDGGALNNNWTSALNWVGDNAPVANDSLVFDGFARLAPSNDFATATAFNGIAFPVTAGAFTLAGNQLTLGGAIVDNTAVLTQTINLPVALNGARNVDVASNGFLAIGGVISGAGFGITKIGNGTLTLSGSNTFTGSLRINAGLVSVGADVNLGAVPAAATPSQLLLDGGTVRASGSFALAANRGIAVGPATGAGAGTVDVVSGSVLTYGGVIANNGSGNGSLTKTSFGGLTLSGANSYAGPTIVEVGTLTLDFAQATSPTNNIIAPTSALTLGGANAGLGGTSFAALTMLGGTAPNSQTLNGTTIDIGPAIVHVNSGGGAATLNLGPLNHNPGGVVNFVRPVSGNITTTTGNTSGIIGGWATVGTGVTVGTITVGNEWAAVDGSGNIVPYTGHLNYVTGSTVSSLPGYAATSNLRINNTSTGDVIVDTAGAASTTNLNTIQFSEAAARSIIIGAGNTLRLGKSGGIFRSDAATAAITWAIGTSTGGANGIQNEGTLTAGGAADTSGELVFTINAPSQTAGSLNVEARVADNGTGAVSVVKAGPGSMKFRGNNTYSGGTYILQGRFQLAGSEIGAANPDGWGTGPIFVMPGAQAFPSGAGTNPITNNWFLAGNGISDNVGAIRLSSGGVLSGTVTLIGDTRLGGGGTNAAAGGGGVISGKITGPFNLDFGAVGNSGNGHNVAIISNSTNDWTGNTTIVGRTGGTAGNSRLVLGANEVIPDGAGKGNVIIGNSGNTVSTCTLDLNGFNETINGLVSAGTATLDFVQNNAAATNSALTVGGYDQTTTFAGIIQDGAGTVGLTKIGSGILTLSGANSFTGETNINAGTLSVTGAGASLSTTSAVKVNTAPTNAGTLSGTSPVGNVTLAARSGTQIARLAPGPTGALGAIGTLTLSSLTVNGGDLQFDLLTPGTSDFLDISGAANFAAASTISPGPAGAAGTYILLTAAGGLTMAVPPTLNPPANTRSTFNLDTVSAPNSIKLIVTGGPKTLTWTGSTNNVWDVVNTTNWNANSGPEKFFTGDSVIFGNGPSNRNVNLSVAVLPGSITVNNSSVNDYTIGGGGSIGGSSNIIKNGDGTLIMATNNTYTGSNLVNAGSVQLGAGGTAGDLGTGIVTNNGALVVNRTDSFVLTNVIEGTGEVRQVGSGVLTLSGTNTYDGATTIAAGTLKVTNDSSFGSSVGPTLVASGATLDLGGNSVVNNLNLGPEQINIRGNGVGGNGALINTGVAQQNALQRVALLENATVGGTARFDIRATDGMLDLAGFTLTKTGPNQFTIVNATVTDGNIVVNQGILAIEAASAVEDFATGKSITYNSGTTAQFFQNTGLVTRPMIFNGSGIQVGNAGNALATIASNLTLNGDVTFTALNNSTGELALNGVISEAGGPRSLTKTGGSTLTLNGTNTYSGATNLNGGAIGFSNLNNLGVGTALNFAGGTLQYGLAAGNIDISTRTVTLGPGGGTIDTNGNDVNFANPIGNGGTGGLTKAGAGTLAFASANTYSGPTNLNGGVLLFSALNQLGSGNAINFGGGTLRYATGAGNIDISTRTVTLNVGDGTIDTNGRDITFANSIGNGGAGGLAKTGLGTLTLSATNAYLGTTTVLAGTLRLGNAGALPNGTAVTLGDLNTNSNGVLDLAGFNATVGGLATGGSGTANIVGNSSTTADSTLTFNTGSSLFDGKIQDSLGSGTRKVGLTVSSGALTLNGANNYSGPTVIESGTLQIGSGTSSGTVGSAGITNNGTLVFNRNDSLTVANAMGGSGTFEQAGTGILTFAGAGSYTGNTTVSAGTLFVTGSLTGTVRVMVNFGMLQLGAAERINDAAPLVLGNAKFSSNGFSETLGVFTLAGAGNLDLGNGASKLHFADSSAAPWTGTLSIANWNGAPNGGGTDEIFFGTSGTGLADSQLSLISFVDPFGVGSGTFGARLLPTGELLPIPEANIVPTFLGGIVFVLNRRRALRG